MNRRKILENYKLTQMSNGCWYCRIDGVKHQFHKREDLENWIIASQVEKDMTLQLLWPDYLESRQLEVAQTTWSKDVFYWETYIRDSQLATIPLKNIRVSDCKSFAKQTITAHKDKMTRHYWNNIRGTLSTLFQHAVNDELIAANPFKNFQINQDLFKKVRKSDEDQAFSDEEKAAVIDAAYLDAETTGNFEPLGIVLLFHLGIRCGELCGLKWSDIDGNTIHIQRMLVANVKPDGKANGTKIVEHTKTTSGDRILPMLPNTVEIFQKIREMSLAKEIDGEYVFMKWSGGHIVNCTERSFEPRLKKYCKQVGMTELKSPHDVRRTVITNLCKAGMPLAQIQAFAGHSTIGMTQQYIKNNDRMNNVETYLAAL